ncbi:hypothetical protein EB001_28015, partial [bacterium]|nr:hypothetical protein [bacterium]
IDIVVSADQINASASLGLYDVRGYINDISIQADGYNSRASASITASYDLTIDSNIHVEADQNYASASLYLGENFDGSVNLDDISIIAAAHGYDSYVSIDMNDASAYGNVTDISVIADNEYAFAKVSIDGNISITNMMKVSADGNYASAILNMNTVHLYDGGNVNVITNHEHAYTELGINNLYANFTGDTLSVYANGYDATSSLYLGFGNITGNITGIEVSATNQYALASADIQGSLNISNNIVVEASDNDATANLHVNEINFDNGSIHVSAEGTNAQASLDITTVSGHLNGISVYASSDASASLDIGVAWGSSDGDNVTSLTGDISVSAAYGGNASADIH